MLLTNPTKYFKMYNKNAISLILFFFVFVINAQVSLKEISLKQQIENSSVVVEGKVIYQKSYWDADHKMIYTAHTISPYKIFKGKPETTFEIITQGGIVDMDAILVSHSLELKIGSIGVFTLYDSNVLLGSNYKTNNKIYKVYSSVQGFYSYDVYNDEVIGVFKKQKGIKTSFYNEILQITKKNYQEVSVLDTTTSSSLTNKSSLLVPGNISFSPTIITAGTKSVLTINGNGFGSVRGRVSFRNADNGGASFVDALASEVLTWSDTQITVEVPAVAGTGSIRVVDSSNSNAVSSSIITIISSQTNVTTDDGNAFQVQHYDDNGLGGYTLEMENRFFNESDNPGARADFEVALEKWRCETKINWELSNIPSQETTREAPGNIVAFDNVANLEVLPTGNLATTFTSFSGLFCPSGVIWFVTGVDILFNKDINWHFGDGPILGNQIDFESVALHELGHAHQLGHVIDPGGLMHFRVFSGNVSNKDLDQNSIDAANDVQIRSTTNQICGRNTPLMTNYAGTCTLGNNQELLTGLVSVYPNPAKEVFFIKNESAEKLNRLLIYDLSGRQVLDYKLTNTTTVEAINTTGISKGMYLLSVESNTSKTTLKLIID